MKIQTTWETSISMKGIKSVETTELTGSGYDSMDFISTQNEQSCDAVHLGRRAVFLSNMLPQLQFKTLVSFYQTTRCQVQEDTNMHGHRCGKAKSHKVMLLKVIYIYIYI